MRVGAQNEGEGEGEALPRLSSVDIDEEDDLGLAIIRGGERHVLAALIYTVNVGTRFSLATISSGLCPLSLLLPLLCPPRSRRADAVRCLRTSPACSCCRRHQLRQGIGRRGTCRRCGTRPTCWGRPLASHTGVPLPQGRASGASTRRPIRQTELRSFSRRCSRSSSSSEHGLAHRPRPRDVHL